jgi:hypothetical protein
VQDGRDQSQHVHRSEHDRGHADDRPGPAAVEDACEDQELSGERRRAGNGERDDPCRHQQRRERRAALRHPAEQRELAGRRAALDDPREEEHRTRDEGVGDRLEDRPGGARLVPREEAEGDEAHLRERRVGEDAAQVGRAERDERAVDEADRGEHEDGRPPVLDGLRELLDRDPQEPVHGRLRDDPREHRRDLGRGLAVRVGEPPVEGEERRLDRERDEEPEEDPVAPARPALDEVERALRDPVDDDRREHQQRPGHRVDDELDRRERPPRPAPDADEHVERDQHRLERRVEEKQVLRREHGDDRARQEEHQPEVRASAVAAGPEGIGDRRRHEDHGRADEPQREPVEADVVRDAEVLEPLHLLLRLEVAAPELEAERGVDPERDLDERREQRERARPEARERQQPDDERGGEWNEDQRGRHRVEMKTRVRIATPAATART